MNAKAKSPISDEVSKLSYEEARDELKRVVAELEQQQVSLEDSLRLWERGEALAKHCQEYLSGAKRRLDGVLGEQSAK